MRFCREHRLLPSTMWTLHRGLCASALRLLCVCHAAPPTAVGGAHNSPIANDIIIILLYYNIEDVLVHYRIHYNIHWSGSFNCPDIILYSGMDTRQKGPTVCSTESEKTWTTILVVKCFSQEHVTMRKSFKLATIYLVASPTRYPLSQLSPQTTWQ